MKRRGLIASVLIAIGLPLFLGPIFGAAPVQAIACTISGTPRDDVLTGTSGNDVICGSAGADLINGGAGDDVLIGNGGNDKLLGKAGADALFGGKGVDCDDKNPAVHPGATETCNAIDDDCNAKIDDGLTFVDYYVDFDGDGYGAGTATIATSISFTAKRARSLIVACGSGPETATHITGLSSGFVFVITGGSIAVGSRRCACAIFVCTSWSAASTAARASLLALPVAPVLSPCTAACAASACALTFSVAMT